MNLTNLKLRARSASRPTTVFGMFAVRRLYALQCSPLNAGARRKPSRHGSLYSQMHILS